MLYDENLFNTDSAAPLHKAGAAGTEPPARGWVMRRRSETHAGGSTLPARVSTANPLSFQAITG